MTGQLARLAARISRPSLTRRTVRARLTLLYGSLFLASGAGLLAITYALAWSATNWEVSRTPGGVEQTIDPQPIRAQHEISARIAHQRASDMHQLLASCGIALGVTAALSILLGWIVAGRVLRPLRSMTLATRTISAENLHHRLALPGPRDELKDLADTIDGLLEQLEQAFDAHRNFAASASHELRTPLTFTRALVQMRLRDPHTTTEQFRSTCDELLTASDQQERVIDALLTLARSHRGLDHRKPLDLAAITTEVVDDLQPTATTRPVHLELTTEPTPILGDPDLIERLVTNLVENAIRYNIHNGSVHILVHHQHGARPALRITNTGPRLAPEQLPQLLQPFQRAISNRSSAGDGVGLGLSIVAAITHAHAATLNLQAQPDGGLDITVSFPPAARQGRNLPAAGQHQGRHHPDQDSEC